MPIVATNAWLKEYETLKKSSFLDKMEWQRDVICEKLLPYFTDATTFDIQFHLLQYGLFNPETLDKKAIDAINQSNYWSIAQVEFHQLRKEWNGPDIPIFIFPSNFNNRALKNEFNGRSGLAHKDKMFLFIPPKIDSQEIKALITHEYNHVCRLHYLNQNEEDINLLEHMVMEGLAEMAVKERVGEKHLSKWTSIYSVDFAKDCWEKWIKTNMRKKRIEQFDFMYGNTEKQIPKWMGYNVGYHLVCSFINHEKMKAKIALQTPTERILKRSVFSEEKE